MDYVKRFKLLISAPSDVSEELAKIDAAVRLFNRTMGEAQGMFIDLHHWSTHSHPQNGDRPQEILNEQFIRDCDAVIAVFGTRFGTPTGKYDSGTEEEIEEMIKAGKPVFLYFSEAPKEPSTIDLKQFEKVKEFKAKFQSHGLYGAFKNIEEIERKVHSDLSLYFLKNAQNTDVAAKPTLPESSFKISSGEKENTFSAYSCDCPKLISTATSSIFSEIESLISQISALAPKQPVEIEKAVALNKIATGQAAELIKMFNEAQSVLGGPVSVDREMCTIIEAFVYEKMNRSLPKNFFHLEDLREDRLAGVSLPFGRTSPVYKGSEASQKQFSLICELERKVKYYVGIEKWIGQFEKINMIQPVLTNSGERFDEDITVDLFFPGDTLFDPARLLKPAFSSSELITDHYLPFLFLPKKTVDIEIFDEYGEDYTPSFSHLTPFRTHDEVASQRNREYLQWIKNHFCYEIYTTKDRLVVTCKFSYLRQHTSMFFPAPILLTKPCSEVSYRIRSKHSSKITEGILKIE